MGSVPGYFIDVLVLWDQRRVPGNPGRTQSFPSVTPGIGQPQENGFLRFGRAGLLESRDRANGMTINALGVLE